MRRSLDMILLVLSLHSKSQSARRLNGAPVSHTCNEKLASLVYFDPFGERWLWYRKNSRGVMVPNSGTDRADSFSWRRWKVRLGPSLLLMRGEPEALRPRARVMCGLKGRSSFGIPSEGIVSSIAAASATSSGPEAIPIQKTRAEFGVGKNP